MSTVETALKSLVDTLLRKQDVDDVYRDRARDLIAAIPGATVPTFGSVQQVADGGAFVECTVFVPDVGSRSHEEPRA